VVELIFNYTDTECHFTLFEIRRNDEVIARTDYEKLCQEGIHSIILTRTRHPSARALGRFFEGGAKTGLGWESNPWEKVGFTDMVKCPTRNSKGQWAKLKPSERRKITENCRKYLTHQLNEISPSIIMTYGADVCRWFYQGYTQDDAYTSRKFMINSKSRSLILVPQVQGGNTPKRLIEIVQDMITENLTST